MRIFYFFPLLLLSLMALQAGAQGIAIGQWRDHMPYKKARGVADAGDRVYCMSEAGFYYYHKEDNSIQRLSKVNGLSDTEFSAIAYSHTSDLVVVAYKNANVDLLYKDGKVINISDIKRANIIGNKTINSISISGNLAYLSCGFGIVVMDTDKKEIKDTYYIGPNGAHVNVSEVTTDAANIYAAASTGVYYASLSSNLSNFSAWARFPTLPAGFYNTITTFNDKVYVNLSKKHISSGPSGQDSIFVYENGAWSPFPAPFDYTIRKLRTSNGKLLAAREGDVRVYDATHTLLQSIFAYTFGFVSPFDATIDAATGKMWIADGMYGLVEALDSWNNVNHVPNGPDPSIMDKPLGVYRLATGGSSICFVPGNVTMEWTPSYTFGSVACFEEETWTSVNSIDYPGMSDSLLDFMSLAIHPSDPKKMYVGSWGSGMLEFDNGTLTNIYDHTNSSLGDKNIDPGFVGIGGLAFDSKNNLWITNTETTKPLSVLKADGTWQAYNLSPWANFTNVTSNIMIDRSDRKWIILAREQGLLVFDETQPQGSWARKLNTSAGSGALPSNEVLSLAEDKDGEIWIGTNAGLAVIYSPDLIFSNNNFDAQQIIIQQDGHYQVLLETEAITAIAVDGANRKWIGTASAGVFLMSADGTTEIYHFDETNSPLPSNEITSIAIHPATGEVFFGTPKGLVSFRGTAVEGTSEYGEVYAFPNPVRPGYSGIIAIKGLVRDAEVKITDISGNLVHSTRAEGGQATWNGLTLSGERARSGVYMVFCSDTEGSKTYVTKIVIVN